MKTVCTVTLYKGTSFAETDNAIFDNMNAIISTMAKIGSDLTLAAPFNPTVSTVIKIPYTEAYASALKDSRPTYLKAVYDDGTNSRTYFYFVTDCTRLGNVSISLTVKMDTLNTYNITGKLSSSCYITRQHVDRLSFQAYNHVTHELDAHAIVDKSNEGFTPTLYKISDVKLVDSAYQYDWYLIYKTRDDITQGNLTNPVAVYLCADVGLKASTGASGSVVTLVPSDIPASSYFYVHRDAGDWQFTPNGHAAYSSGDVMDYVYGGNHVPAVLTGFAMYKLDDSHIGYYLIAEIYVGEVLITGIGVSSITLGKTKEYYVVNELTNQKAEYYGLNTVHVNSGTISDSYSFSFSQVDCANSKLIKIIDLPYCPVTRTNDGNGNVSLSGFGFDRTTGLYKAASVSAGFSHTIGDSTIADYLNNALIHGFSYVDKAAMLANAHFIKDPKTYGSQFYTFKLSYDSFSTSIPLETIIINSKVTSLNATLTFKATNTINSNFMFSVAFGNATMVGQEDYPAVLLSTRNNEKPIFTNDYINYLKTGYNYDKKAKALSAISEFGSAGLSIATGVASAALGNPITVAAGVSMIGAGIAGISSAISSTIANENAFASKLASLRAQASSVSGSDDIDLLKAYNGNRLHLSIWEPSEDASALFDELFRLYGYKRANYGVPNTTSREWFNFVAAQIVVDPSATLPNAVLEDESAKWANGVTVFHLPLATGSAYDLHREKENWEVALVNGAFPS